MDSAWRGTLGGSRSPLKSPAFARGVGAVASLDLMWLGCPMHLRANVG